MPLVNVEGIGVINFDDAMSPQQIESAIRNNILPQFGREVPAPQTRPAPTAESVGRGALQRNILDPAERGYQNLMMGISALRSRSPESFYGLTPEEAAQDIVSRQQRLREIPRTEASQTAFREAEQAGAEGGISGIAGATGRLATSASALGDITAESFGANPLAAPVGLLANVTPIPGLRQAIGTLAGALGFPTEFATSMGDALLKTAQERGVDTNNPRQIAELIRSINSNPELRDKMRNDALTRASIISAVDAAAGYGAGRLVTRGAAARIGGGAAAEGIGGGIGEAGAQLATEGKIDPVEVAAEVLGGGGMGAAGNIRRSPGPPPRGEDEELRAALQDIVNQRPPEPPAPLALPREVPSIDLPTGMLTRTQAENYMTQLEESRYPEIRFMPFEDKVRYVRNKLEEERADLAERRQGYEEAIRRGEIAFSPETQQAFDLAELQRQHNIRVSEVVNRIPLEREQPYAAGREAEATEAFRLAELQRRSGVRPDIEAVGPVQELAAARDRLESFMASSRDATRRLQAAQKRTPINAVEIEALRAEIADLSQKVRNELSNISVLESRIPAIEREETRLRTQREQAAPAFEVAERRRERAGPEVTDLRAGAAAPGENRLVLEPQFDSQKRLVGGEAITRIDPTPDEKGRITAYVNRMIDGEIQEVGVPTTPDKIYQFPMLETPRITQETIAARVGPEQVAGRRGAGIDPNQIDLQPRRVTDRTSSTGVPAVAAPGTTGQTVQTAPAVRPDYRIGEPVEAAPEQPLTLPSDIKSLLTFMRKGKTKPKGQVSLVQQLIKAGGLRDTGGEILQYLGGNVRNRPGLINRKRRAVEVKGGKPQWVGGFELDQAAEFLAGEGYFIDIPTDNELLDAINDELSGRAVNYGPTEDIEGQQLEEAARDLEREMDAVGVSIRDSDEDIARALGLEPSSEPRTLEDIEREDEARRISYSARRAKTETEAQAQPAVEEEAPESNKAREIVDRFLDALRARGKAGRLLANELSNLLKNNKINANQLYEAFMVSNTLLDKMPAGANYRFRFLEDIVIDNEEAAKRSGAEVGRKAQGRVLRPTESLPGFVELSLAEEMLPYLRETAAHEAFHVLQDYFGVYDKGFNQQINKYFKNDMTLNDMEPSIKRRLQSLKAPNSSQSYWDSLVEGIGLDTPLDASEAQAYAFGSLTDAMMRGQNVTGLIAPFQRFANFVKDFFSKLRSSFRGDGFRTPADLLAGAGERAASLTQEAPTKGEARYSARGLPKEIADNYESFSKDLAAPIVYADKNVALLEGISRYGDPVYIGARADGYRSTVDIENYKGNLFTKDQLDLLKQQKKNRLRLDEELFAKNPNGPFAAGSKFASSENMPKNLSGFGEGLVRLLQMNDIKVFFVSDKDTVGDSNFTEKYKLHGPYARARESLINNNEYGIVYPSQKEKFYTVKMQSGLRPSMQMETMAHEIGHIFEKVVLRNSPKETIDALVNAHARWYEKTKGVSVKEYISAMRPLITGRVTLNEAAESLKNKPAASLDRFYSYWSSFDEWFADGVAKWATTAERPKSLVDKFFARIAEAYRKIVNALTGIGVPDQTVANFIESYIDGKLTENAPSTKMKPGEQLSLFSAKPQERFSARKVPAYSGRAAQPGKVAPGKARTLYEQINADIEKPGIFDSILATILDKKKNESILDAFVRTSINRFGAFHNVDKMARAQGYTGISAMQALEMSMNNSGRLKQILYYGMGRIDPKTGIIKFRADVKPIFQIMKENGITTQNKDQFKYYLASLRERDLRRNGRKGFFNVTDQQIATGIAEDEKNFPQWKKAAQEIDKFNGALIDWALDTGLVSKAQSDNLRSLFYTPFYRLMDKNSLEDPTRSVTPRIGESFTNVVSALQKELGGGTKPLGDIFENMIRNADSIMKAGLKNMAMRTAAETMELAKVGKKNTTGQKTDGTITYKVNGKDVLFDVEDAALFSALAGMPRTMQNGIYDAMAKIATYFRNFVTIAPAFIFSNLYKGKISAFVQEGQPFMTNTFAGLRDAYNASTSLRNFQLQTGFGGLEHGMGERNLARAFENSLSDEGIMKALAKFDIFSAMRQGIQKVQAVSEASEMAERIKLAENLMKKGVPERDALWQGYMLAPYARRGTGQGFVGSSLHFFMPLVPFLNAKIQTTYRLVENEKGDKRRIWTLGLPQQLFLRGLVLSSFSMLAYLAAIGDDEDKWDKLPNYMKLNYDMIPLGENWLSLPRAYEIGTAFGAIPVFILDAIRRGESKDLAEALAFAVGNIFWMNPMPKAVDPLLSVVTNYDFFRKRPLETKGDEAKPIGERINRSTTKTGEVLATTINSVFGDVISPIKAQALLDGYTGTMGVAIMNGFDSILASLGVIPSKPAGAFGDPATMPAILANFSGLNRFYREDASMVSRYVGDFYKIKEMTDQLVRSQNDARRFGDFERLTELQGETGLPLRMRQTVNSVSREITDINKRIALIERRDLDAVTKADSIQPLLRRRDAIAKRVVDQAKALGVY